jgi:hypothetical protein
MAAFTLGSFMMKLNFATEVSLEQQRSTDSCCSDWTTGMKTAGKLASPINSKRESVAIFD